MRVFFWGYYFILVQEFILRKDNMSSEHVINYKSYKNWPRIRAVPVNNVFNNCSCKCSVWLLLPIHSDLRSDFACSGVHGDWDYPFRGTATHCLMHVTVGWYVPHYPFSVSVVSHDSACLVKIILCGTGIHKFVFLLTICITL
jgi:hypothetical protein